MGTTTTTKTKSASNHNNNGTEKKYVRNNVPNKKLLLCKHIDFLLNSAQETIIAYEIEIELLTGKQLLRHRHYKLRYDEYHKQLKTFNTEFVKLSKQIYQEQKKQRKQQQKQQKQRKQKEFE